MKIKNKPWKKWRTRKITFVGVLFVWVLLIIFDLVGIEMSDIIVENVFDKGIWVIGTGTIIVLADSKKNKEEQ